MFSVTNRYSDTIICDSRGRQSNKLALNDYLTALFDIDSKVFVTTSIYNGSGVTLACKVHNFTGSVDDLIDLLRLNINIYCGFYFPRAHINDDNTVTIFF